MFCSQDIQFLFFELFHDLPVHETRCIFKYIFRTTTHKVPKSSQLTDVNINKGNNFTESLKQFRALGLSSRPFSI